jgi:hypothetical protein
MNAPYERQVAAKLLFEAQEAVAIAVRRMNAYVTLTGDERAEKRIVRELVVLGSNAHFYRHTNPSIEDLINDLYEPQEVEAAS